MRLSLALSVLPLALSVSALKVIEPEQGAVIDTSDSLVVKWTSVDTDETSFNVFLVNNNVYPPVHKKVASDIKTSEHSYTIDSLSGVTDAKGYQINLESTSEHNTGILAQSNQFNVTESASSSTSTGASSSTSSAATSGSSTASSTESSSSSPVSTTHTSAGTSTSTKSGSSTTATGATTTASGTSTASGMTTATSASGSASGTASASATPSTGAGVALGAAPFAVGLLAGVLALGL